MMNHRRRWLLPLLACLALRATSQAQQDFSKVEIKTTHVAGNVYVLEGQGGNIGVSAGPDGLLIVDDEFAPLADKIEAALKQINPGNLKFVLNTHFHGDHTGANVHFGRQAPIIAHANVRKHLTGGAGVRPEPKEGLPVVTFDDSLSLHFNGEEIKVLHVPAGHTDSDSLIFFTKSNVVHMGDQFFSGRFPNIDLNGGGGDVRGYIRNVEEAIKKIPPDAKIIPGHGPLSGIKELKEFHEMLVGTAGFVEKEIAAGKTLAEVKAAGLPQEWKSWDKPAAMGADRWLDILYRGLKRNPADPTATPSAAGGAAR
jgi:cyclase